MPDTTKNFVGPYTFPYMEDEDELKTAYEKERRKFSDFR